MTLEIVVLTNNCEHYVHILARESHNVAFYTGMTFFVLQNVLLLPWVIHTTVPSFCSHVFFTNTVGSFMWWEYLIIFMTQPPIGPRNESPLMMFDQTPKLNETWRGLARGPMRDDSADSSPWETPGQAPPNPFNWPHSRLATCHRPRCVSTKLNVSWQPSNSTAPDWHQLIWPRSQIPCTDPDMICYVWILMQQCFPAR